MSQSARAIAEGTGAKPELQGRGLSDRVLILGLGNPLAEDDGIGVFTLDILRMNYRFEPEVTLVDGGTLGVRLVSSICRASYLLVLDAYRNRARAGTVSVVSLDVLPATDRTRTTAHGAGLPDVLMAAELVGSRPPGVLVGVEPANLGEGKSGLSRPVCNALPTLIQTVIRQLNSIGVTARPESTRRA